MPSAVTRLSPPNRPVVPYDLGGTRWSINVPRPAPNDGRLVSDGAAVAGAPESYDLAQYVARVYDQGTVPACAAYSAAAMQSIFEAMERGQWMAFDALECYRAVGGSGSRGVDSTSVLAYMQSTGLLAAGSVHRYRIASYAVVPLGPGGQLDPVKVALAANRPVVLSMFLPRDWGQNAGQSSGGDISSSLHQVCLTGYDPDRLYFVNSQGGGWGDGGFGSVPASFVLQADQGGWSFAYTTVDAVDDPTGAQ